MNIIIKNGPTSVCWNDAFELGYLKEEQASIVVLPMTQDRASIDPGGDFCHNQGKWTVNNHSE